MLQNPDDGGLKPATTMHVKEKSSNEPPDKVEDHGERISTIEERRCFFFLVSLLWL